MSVEGCDCPITVRVMAYLGAQQAARMHGNPDVKFEGPEWTAHIEEEEKFFFPLVRVLWPEKAAELDAHHTVFRQEIAKYGNVVSEELLRRHVDIEDWCASELLKRGVG